MNKNTNIIWHHAAVPRYRREQQNNYRSAVLWFTEFSDAGKSILAHAMEEVLYRQGYRTFCRIFSGFSR